VAQITRTRRSTAVAVSAVGAAAALGAFAVVSPWPSALAIRALFERDARRTRRRLDDFAPDHGLIEHYEVAYGDSPDMRLNWFCPEEALGALPVVIWIHGGGWISGCKEDVDPYLRMIASQGYTTVSLDYSPAPEHEYPTALQQLNAALKFLSDNAAGFNVDPGRFVLAGDSAGAQLATQLATAITSPLYAKQVDITPGLTSDQLTALVLHCGVFDLSDIPNTPGLVGWGTRTALWSYLGDRDWSKTPGAAQMSVIHHVTKDFPPTFISGGNGDALTETQSLPFAQRLSSLGVPVTKFFHSTDAVPALPHEYQFKMEFAESPKALAAAIHFLDRVTV
jgi:acetyl esterase/lipase